MKLTDALAALGSAGPDPLHTPNTAALLAERGWPTGAILAATEAERCGKTRPELNHSPHGECPGRGPLAER